MLAESLFVGIDAGGTNARLLASGTTHRFLGPGANPKRLGFPECTERLTALVQEAVTASSPVSLQGVCAGVAGVSTEEDAHMLSKALKSRLGVPALIMGDIDLTVESAFSGESGMVLIAGTGSNVALRTRDNRIDGIGGWGYLLGDEGSGHRIGLRGLRAVARMIDGGPATLLHVRLKEAFKIGSRGDLLTRVYDGWPPAEAAPLVLKTAQEGDTLMQQIVRQEADALAKQAAQLASRHLNNLVPRFFLNGGLMQNEMYADLVSEAIKSHHPSFERVDALELPEEAALRLAKTLA